MDLQDIAVLVDVKGGLGEAIQSGYLKPEYFEDLRLAWVVRDVQLGLEILECELEDYYP